MAQKIICYLSQNEAVIGLLLSLVAILISIISIIISIYITHKQNKIALLEKRIAIFDKIEDYVYKIHLWEFEYSWFSNLKLSKTQIKALFNSDFLDFYIELEKASKQIDKLWGNHKHAEEKGECNGKSEEQIEQEINNITGNIKNDFENIKDDFFKKFFKV